MCALQHPSGASKMQKAKAKVQVKLQAVKKERASKRDSKNSSTATITKGERSANDVPVAEPSPFAASGAAQPSSATADDEVAAPAREHGREHEGGEHDDRLYVDLEQVADAVDGGVLGHLALRDAGVEVPERR